MVALGRKQHPLLEPWEKRHGRCEEADQVESGVWELAFHHPVGIGGAVAGDADGIVQQGYHKVHQEAACQNKPVDESLWKERRKHCWGDSLDQGGMRSPYFNFVLNFYFLDMQRPYKPFLKMCHLMAYYKVNTYVAPTQNLNTDTPDTPKSPWLLC